MNRVILFLSLAGLFSCDPSRNIPSDMAARASGKYVVQAYMINGDTLYTSQGVNKIDVTEFYILVERMKPDSVRVAGVYRKRGKTGIIRFSKDVGVRETSGGFQFLALPPVSSLYESGVIDQTFYERNRQGGVVIFPSSYVLKNPANPALEGVIILARK